jgi:hypothetical protein
VPVCKCILPSTGFTYIIYTCSSLPQQILFH